MRTHKNSNDKEIGLRLKEARERAGLSQAQAATLIGRNREIVNATEMGRRALTARELQAFSELYAVGYDWLLGDFTESDLPDELVVMCEKLPPIDRRKLLKTLATFGEMY